MIICKYNNRTYLDIILVGQDQQPCVVGVWGNPVVVDKEDQIPASLGRHIGELYPARLTLQHVGRQQGL